MISVLIPTYNYDVRELVTTIHKLCVNEKITFEILILDDCSTDLLSYELNQKISNLSNVTFSKNETNQGRTATRNKLAESAKFDWLLFLDADVLPKADSFISNYLKTMSEAYDCIFGGICYTKEAPQQEQLLRWLYGKLREAKAVDQRNTHPFDIISQNLLIKKKIFFDCNPSEYNFYGMDILFSYNLKKTQAKMLHIDNPVIHHGLESSASFLDKSLKAVESTYKMEKAGLISEDARPLQRAYLKLKKARSLSSFQKTYKLIASRAEKNLTSKNPSIRLLDAYKLNYYIKLKRHG